LRVPHLDVLGVQPRLDPFTDQPTGYRVGVVSDVDRAARVDPHRQPPTRFQAVRRQRPQHGQLLGQTGLAAGIQLYEQMRQKQYIDILRGEIATAAQHQCLIHGAFEPMMPLFSIAVFVAAIGVSRLTFQAVVPQ
jgi:hypothetical protein